MTLGVPALQGQHRRARHPGAPVRLVTGIPWPGPDPGSTRLEDLHPLIRARLATAAGQPRDLTGQEGRIRETARTTGCGKRTVSAAPRRPVPCPDESIDPHWLREQYRDRQRSLDDSAGSAASRIRGNEGARDDATA